MFDALVKTQRAVYNSNKEVFSETLSLLFKRFLMTAALSRQLHRISAAKYYKTRFNFKFKRQWKIKGTPWYKKQTCQLVLHTVPLIAERQAEKLVNANFEKSLVCPILVPNPGVSRQRQMLCPLNHLRSANLLKHSIIYNPL